MDLNNNLRPSLVKKKNEELFSNYLKEKVVIGPLLEFQNTCDIIFEKIDELKAYKLFYILTKASYECNDMRVYESPVTNKIYLTISYENNITESEK